MGREFAEDGECRQARDMPIAAETIYDFIRELGADTCAAYSECFKKIGAAKLQRLGFDPKTLLVFNLELRESPDLPKDKLWLTGDGCGNYYFVEAGDRRGAVSLWSHDPPGIEPMNEDLAAFLKSAEQIDPIATEAPPGDAYISRTKVPGESILDPIGLEEWLAVVRQIPALEFVGYLKGTNPLTGEEMRFESPGLSIGRVGGRGFYIGLRHGRLSADRLFDEAKPLVEQIAGALGCHVMFGPPDADE
jgi:hypothetical protein